MKRKQTALAMVLVLLLCLLCGCGGSGGGDKSAAMTTDSAPQEEPMPMPSEAGSGFYEEQEATGGMEKPMTQAEDSAAASTETAGAENLSADAKLIYRLYMDIETLDYESSLKAVDELCGEMGGYVEYSDVSGTRYDADYTRSASFTLRIPSDRLDEFESSCGGIGNVYNSRREVENATAQYVDLSTRLKAYETEQERLLELLEQAVNLEDVISLNARLSEVRYEIDSINSSLRGIDSLVDYSTVVISLYEVEEHTDSYQVPHTFGEKLSNTFSRSLASFQSFISRVGVFVLGELPLLLVKLLIILIIPALIVLAVVLIVKRHKKKKQASKPADAPKEQEENSKESGDKK